MRRISSGGTFFYKRIFPALWFGIIVVFVTVVTATGKALERPDLFVAPAIMALFGYLMMRTLLFDLVDEVLDGGSYLLVRNRGEEERIALADVINVSATHLVNPPRISLRLSAPGRFGKEVVFSPVKGAFVNPFRKNPIAEELIVRVDRARRGDPQAAR